MDSTQIAAAREALALFDAAGTVWHRWHVRCEFGHDIAGYTTEPPPGALLFQCEECAVDEVDPANNFVVALSGTRRRHPEPTPDHLRAALAAYDAAFLAGVKAGLEAGAAKADARAEWFATGPNRATTHGMQQVASGTAREIRAIDPATVAEVKS